MTSARVFARIEAEKARYLDELIELLRIPSVSTDPAFAGEVARCARHLQRELERIGLAAERFDLGGHPLVYGEWLEAPGRPTLLVYGHYDVQPADPLPEWRHPPFEPAIEDGNLIARGVTDDKAQLFCHLKAAEAILAERGALPVNLKVLLEGEEESGGESILRFVEDDAGRRLAADAVLISDSEMLAPGKPAIYTSLRGIAYFELEARGPNRDLHSGQYGGAVANPANALARVLGALVDDDGRIAVPGFYDDVRELGRREREELARVPFDEAAYRQDLGLDALFGEPGYTTPERAAVRPTCDVHGLWGGYQGAGGKTVLPAKAGAKVSMRLVPDQDPDRIAGLFGRYARELCPPGIRLETRLMGGSRPVRVDTAGPIAEAALDAMREVWGAPAVKLRGGGSIPIAGAFAEVLGAPVLLIGFGLPDDGAHAPNEKFALEQLYGGIRSAARIYDRVGELG